MQSKIQSQPKQFSQLEEDAGRNSKKIKCLNWQIYFEDK